MARGGCSAGAGVVMYHHRNCGSNSRVMSKHHQKAKQKKKKTRRPPEVREGEGEEGIQVLLLLKFGDELAKRGDERRLRLEFMELLFGSLTRGASSLIGSKQLSSSRR